MRIGRVAAIRAGECAWGMHARVVAAAAALVAVLAAAPGFAQGQKSSSDDQLASHSEDPTAALMSFEVDDWYQSSLYDKTGTINQGVFRAVLPFTVGAVDNIFRVTEQYTTQAYNNKLGGEDPELVYLAGTSVPWGRWGIGAVLEPPTGSQELTSDKWSIGPSAAVLNTRDPDRRWGMFLRSYTSFAGSEKAKKVGIINLQPLYTLKVGNGSTLSLGETEAVYNTAESKWKTLQVGLKFGHVVTFGTGKWKPTAEADYNFCNNTSGNARWTLRVGITALVPEW